MLRKLAAAAAYVAAIGMVPDASRAARVAPMSIELSTTGRNAMARIEVSNAEDRMLPMEVRMYRGIISEEGQLSLEPADEEFVVFPPQVVLQPQSQQVFRIQYVGGPLSRSEVFYASVSQIPVQLELTESRIQVLMRFNVIVNVVPDNTVAAPVVSWVRPTVREYRADDPNLPEEVRGQVQRDRGLEVRIENQGTRYFAAGRTGWTVTATEESGAAYTRTFSQAQIADTVGMGVVAPGRARIFFLPIDRPLRDGSVSVAFDK